jgi:hypothetical protein
VLFRRSDDREDLSKEALQSTEERERERDESYLVVDERQEGKKKEDEDENEEKKCYERKEIAALMQSD